MRIRSVKSFQESDLPMLKQDVQLRSRLIQVICQSINYTGNNFVIILGKKHVHNEKP